LDLTVLNEALPVTSAGERYGKLLNGVEYDASGYQTIGLQPNAPPLDLNTSPSGSPLPMPDDGGFGVDYAEGTVHMDAAYCEESGRYFLIAYSSYWVAKYELHPNGLIYLGHDYVDHGNAVLSPAAFYTQRSVKGEAECYCNGNELRVAITYSTLYGVGLPNEPAASLTYASLLHALSFDASDPVLSLNWEQNHVAGSIINDPINYPVDQSGNKIRWIGIGGLEFLRMVAMFIGSSSDLIRQVDQISQDTWDIWIGPMEPCIN